MVAKRWRVRCGTSGSSQRDRPGLWGVWRAGCAADVRIGKAHSTARSGVLVEFLTVSRRPRQPPLRSTGGWRGLRRSCAWARWGLVVHSATGGVADVTPTKRARRAESSTCLATGRQLARRHGGRKGNSPPFQLSVGLPATGAGSVCWRSRTMISFVPRRSHGAGQKSRCWGPMFQ